MHAPDPLVTTLARSSPAVWLTLCGLVEGHDGQPQQIVPNVLQRRIFAYWRACYNAGRPARIIGLKPRKKGFSTGVQTVHYWWMRTAGVKLGLLGHQDNASTDTIFKMVKFFAENDRLTDAQWGNTATKNTADALEYSNGARVIRLTAENPAKVRSTTLQALSGTEAAYYAHSEKVFTAALNALGKGTFTSAAFESTPNGVTGAFYTQWKTARWPSPEECPDGTEYWRQWESFQPQTDTTGVPAEDVFVRIFAAWFEFDEKGAGWIRLTDEQKRAVRESLDAETWYFGEQELIDRYGHTGPDGVLRLGREVQQADVWEQLAWRRKTIQGDCNNDRRKFDEEYPSDPHTCFLSSGYPYFDADSITSLDRAVNTPGIVPRTGVFEWTDPTRRAVRWRETAVANAIFTVWEPPIDGCAYCLSWDVSNGGNNTKGEDPDRHSILVWRRPYRDHTGRMHRIRLVARVRPPCLVPIYTAAEWAAMLATEYQALICPEINGIGQAAVLELRHFPHVSICSTSGGQDPRTGRKVGTVTYGHDTNPYTRTAMLDFLHKLLREECVDILCPHVVYELRQFNNDPKVGKPQAPENEHDDDVLSTAIGMHWLDSAPVWRTPHIRRPTTERRRSAHSL